MQEQLNNLVPQGQEKQTLLNVTHKNKVPASHKQTQGKSLSTEPEHNLTCPQFLTGLVQEPRQLH